MVLEVAMKPLADLLAADIVFEAAELDYTLGFFSSLLQSGGKRRWSLFKQTAGAFCGKRTAHKDGMTMHRIAYLWLAAMVLTGVLINPANAQNSGGQNTSAQNSSIQTSPPDLSLGSYARALKQAKKEPATKQFDNDNLPLQDKLSVVGSAPDSAGFAGTKTADADAKAAQKAATPAVTPGESPEQRQQVYDQWKQNISSQQSQLDALSRELDLEQREYKLRAAEFYRDAGERLRNQAQWDKEDADYKQQIAEKQKALDEAKQKLNDLQEDARKAGVPTSVREDEQPEQ
jgi:hypothetical protein